MRDINGKLWSIQEIAPDGWQHNQEGGRRKGCFFQIGSTHVWRSKHKDCPCTPTGIEYPPDKDGRVYAQVLSDDGTLSIVPKHELDIREEATSTFCIGEGFATCASIHAATGYVVFSAGEAGNLELVAKLLREKYPQATIIICGDDDWLTKANGKDKNVGKLSAQKAATAVDGIVSLPWFGPGRSRTATDFNDMARLSGLDEVATRLKLDIVKHEDAQERARIGEPPSSSTPEDYGLPSGSDEFTDDGLALCFAADHTEKLRYITAWSRWFEWQKNRWRHDQKLHAMSAARKLCRETVQQPMLSKTKQRIVSAGTIAAVERLARCDERLAATLDQWDRDPWLFNTTAGTVDLRTGELHAHSRADYITKLAGASPGGDCPGWRAFIDKITNGDGALAAFLQRMLGYSLTGPTQEQCLFFLYGRGANGKSVLYRFHS